jgi:transmembrane sensor
MSLWVDIKSFIESPLQYWRERRLRSLTREALALVALGGDRAPGFEASLALWLLKSKDHVAVWLDVTAFCEQAARALQYAELGAIAMPINDAGAHVSRVDDKAHAVAPPTRVARRFEVRTLFRRPAFGVGLAIVAAVLLGTGFWLHGTWTHESEYATRIGQHRTFDLPDGTQVHLNTNSRIAVHFTRDARIVDLLQGEALFNIAHEARPFRVRSGGAVIEDIGTQFNVRLEPDHIAVSVIQGQVRIGMLPEKGAEPWMRVAVEALNAGQSVSLNRHARAQHIAIEPRSDEMLARELAWTRGMLQFRGESLSDAVREFNRYNVRQIEIVDAEIGTLRIGGQFQATSPDRFARALGIWNVHAIEPDKAARTNAPIRLVRAQP